MKDIKLCDENKDLINDLCEKARGKGVTERKLDYNAIVDTAKSLSKSALFELPKKYLDKLIYSFHAGRISCKAYKYKYQSDQATIIFKKGCWYLNSISRQEFWPNSKDSKFRFHLTHEESQKRGEQIRVLMYLKYFYQI